MQINRSLIGVAAVATLGVAAAVFVFVVRSGAEDGNLRLPAEVTEAEARQVLMAIVSDAQAGRWDEVCGVPGSSGHGCDRVGGGTVPEEVRRSRPADAPTVLAVRQIASTECLLGGVVLELAGVDASGKEYRSDMFVSRGFDNELAVSMPVYWYGARFAEGSGGCSG